LNRKNEKKHPKKAMRKHSGQKGGWTAKKKNLGAHQNKTETRQKECMTGKEEVTEESWEKVTDWGQRAY